MGAWTLAAVGRRALAAFVATSSICQAADANEKVVETTDIFGFTAGSDVGDDLEAEMETTARAGKRTGSYRALFHTFELGYTPIKNLRIEPAATFSRHDISAVEDLSDTRQMKFHGLSFKAKYRLLERARSLVGLTLAAEPSWTRIDDTSGMRVDQYGAAVSVLMDKELVAGRWFGAFNALYEGSASRVQATAEWEREAKLGFAAALTRRVGPGVFAGIEARYFRKYGALDFGDFLGHAIFAGPTMFVSLPRGWWMSGAWSAQVAGRAADTREPLDLTNFVRHQALFRIGVDF